MKNVLVADHDNEMYTIAKKALQDDYTILPLPHITKLIERLRKNPAELIILSVSDSDTTGCKTYDIIKRVPEMSDKPVIFMGKNTDLELEQRILSLGASDYMTLPITQELLLHRVNTCLELFDLRKERPYVDKYQDAISISFAELVECRDETTGGHLKNTTRYFEILLGAAIANERYKDLISPEDVADLLRSATLHDIGKIGITDEILHKESTLNYHEFEHMKTHTTLGKQAFEKIIKETGGTKWLYLAMDMAYCHHERWDGAGYPNGLKGGEIPFYARMLTIADVYDALTSDRTYKKAFSHQKSTEIIIEGKGSYFDPSLVDLFIEVNQQFEDQLLSNRETLIL